MRIAKILRSLVLKLNNKIALRLSLALLGLAVIGQIASWFIAGNLIAPAPSIAGVPPPDLFATEITLESQSGSIVSGWHIRARESKGIVILAHGIRSSRLSMLERARWLHTEGYSSVLFDLQAHGESSGDYITAGYLEKYDIAAAIEYARTGHPTESIGVIGVSLGGASAALGSPNEIDALVLESVYPDLRSAINNRVAVRLSWLSWFATEVLLAQLRLRLGVSPASLRPIDHLPTVGCPVLIASGAEDRYTKLSETKAMFQVAAEPKELWILQHAAHTDLYRASPEEYERRVLSFFEKHM